MAKRRKTVGQSSNEQEIKGLRKTADKLSKELEELEGRTHTSSTVQAARSQEAAAVARLRDKALARIERLQNEVLELEAAR